MKKAFTMLELTIAVVIIGVLVAIALPVYNKVIEDSHDKEAIANLKLIKSAQISYRSEKNRFFGPQNTGTHNSQNNTDEKALNSNLHLNIPAGVPLAWDYYITSAGANSFVAQAHRASRGYDRIYQATQSSEPAIYTPPPPPGGGGGPQPGAILE